MVSGYQNFIFGGLFHRSIPEISGTQRQKSRRKNCVSNRKLDFFTRYNRIIYSEGTFYKSYATAVFYKELYHKSSLYTQHQFSRCNFPLWGTSVKKTDFLLNTMEYLRIAFKPWLFHVRTATARFRRIPSYSVSRYTRDFQHVGQRSFPLLN